MKIRGSYNETDKVYINGDQTLNVSSEDYHIIHSYRSNDSFGVSFRYQLSSHFLNRQFDGKIAEIIAFDRELTVSERAHVTHYLSKKWGLESISYSDDDGTNDNVDLKFPYLYPRYSLKKH